MSDQRTLDLTLFHLPISHPDHMLKAKPTPGLFEGSRRVGVEGDRKAAWYSNRRIGAE